MKRLAWFTLVMLATLTLALLFWEFRVAVLLFVLSLVVAATVRPLVDRFAARGVPRGLALLLTYAIGIGGLIALVVILSGPLLTDLQQLTQNVASSYEQMKTQWPTGSPFQQTLAQQLPSTDELYQLFTGTLPQTVLGITLGAFDLLGQLMIVLVLSVYWSADQEHFKRLWLSLLPLERRARARLIWQTLESGLGAYLRSQVIQTVLAVIVLGLGYQTVGLAVSGRAGADRGHRVAHPVGGHAAGRHPRTVGGTVQQSGAGPVSRRIHHRGVELSGVCRGAAPVQSPPLQLAAGRDRCAGAGG